MERDIPLEEPLFSVPLASLQQAGSASRDEHKSVLRASSRHLYERSCRSNQRICCLTWKWNFIPKRSAFRRIRSEIRLHQSARACRGTLIALWRKTRGMRLADSAVRNLKYNHRTTPGTGRDLPNPNPEPFVACGGRRAGTVCGIGALDRQITRSLLVLC